MKKSELKNIKSEYELFNIILFNNSLPRANKIDFILHNLSFAAGYSHYRDTPSKTGNMHEIAFCKYFKFTERQIREILIHEMIHLWQVSHVAEWRYKRCSNDIAHDKVFTSKMNTINLILAKRGYDLTIKQVCDDKLKLDPDITPKEYHYIFFGETYSGKHVCFKCTEKRFENIAKSFNTANILNIFKNVYAIKTKSYLFNRLKSVSKIPEVASSSNNMNTGEDMYNPENENNIWIIKDKTFVYNI